MHWFRTTLTLLNLEMNSYTYMAANQKVSLVSVVLTMTRRRHANGKLSGVQRSLKNKYDLKSVRGPRRGIHGPDERVGLLILLWCLHWPNSSTFFHLRLKQKQSGPNISLYVTIATKTCTSVYIFTFPLFLQMNSSLHGRSVNPSKTDFLSL